MSCCGERRQLLARPSSAGRRPGGAEGGTPHPDANRYSCAYFENVGETELTVVGQISGRRYRFDRPGSRVAVDPADKPSLLAVPQLRWVPGP